MDLALYGVAFGRGHKSDDVPLTITIVRRIPGPDRPDYWLGKLHQPLRWVSETAEEYEVTHLVVAGQWAEPELAPGVVRLPVGIAYVIDESLLDDEVLDVEKIRYVATGVADDPEGVAEKARRRSESPTLWDRILGRQGPG